MADVLGLEGGYPTLSYVMPVLNEADYLADAVAAVLAQEYPGHTQIVLAVAPSHDGTETIAAGLAARDDRITLVDNPGVNIPDGLNQAIAAATGEIIVRVDAHSELPPGYARAMVEELIATDSAVIGGRMLATGRGPVQEAIARAYNSPYSFGGGAHHYATEAGESDTAYLGVFRREAIEAVGGYDPTILRGEDYELCTRIRAAGHRIYFDPRQQVIYWPRASYAALVKQMYATGAWRSEIIRRDGRISARHLATPALVVGLGGAGLVWATPLVRFRWLRRLALVPVVAYAGFLALTAPRLGGRTLADKARTALAIATIHVGFGAGLLKGLTAGAGGTRDTSRIKT